MKNTIAFIATSFFCSNLFAQAGFTKIVDAANPVTTFTTPGIYKGTAWIDLDNDNDLDLYAAPNRLFRNDGAGTFFALPNLPFTPLQNPGGASWADLDNDGDIDCIVAQNPSGIYTNDGTGNFTDVSPQIPNLNSFPSWGCAIGNWNNDAFLDFVFAHASGFHAGSPVPSKLYLNTNASLTPQNILGYALTDTTKPYTVPYWSDYDLDGDMDLFVASGPGGSAGPDFCYKNLKIETGFDTLERMTSEFFATQLQDGQCYNFIDADADGDLDLCLTNYAGAQSRFYLNSNGIYSLQVMPFTATAQNLTNDWGDYDNDGDLDVLITNDATATKFYRNNGNLNFSAAINMGSAGGCGITNGDYDNDGDLDLFIHGNGTARALFRNDSAYNNNWVSIKCNGIASNKSAIGTIVKIKATFNGNAYWQIREITAQNSFQSQNDLRVHVGLGNAIVIDSIIIKYPSGQISILTNIAVNTFYCHDEGIANLCLATGLTEPDDLENKIWLYPNPVNNEINITFTNEIIGKKIAITISDLSGRIIKMIDCSLHTKSMKINIASITSGMYSLAVKGNSVYFNAKFVKV